MARQETHPPQLEHADDTLALLFLCTYPSLTPASAVALTLRAVERLGDTEGAARHFDAAARRTTSLPEQRYLIGRSARLRGR